MSWSSVSRRRCCALPLLTVVSLEACEVAPEADAALFPPDYTKTYREVRSCRVSVDHNLNAIRILADPVGYDTYLQRQAPFPVGSTILKEEYSDLGCTQLLYWTVGRKEAAGYDSANGDWRYQQVRPDRSVIFDGVPVSCVAGCHAICGTRATPGPASTRAQKPHPVPEDGWDHMCAD